MYLLGEKNAQKFQATPRKQDFDLLGVLFKINDKHLCPI